MRFGRGFLGAKFASSGESARPSTVLRRGFAGPSIWPQISRIERTLACSTRIEVPTFMRFPDCAFFAMIWGDRAVSALRRPAVIG